MSRAAVLLGVEVAIVVWTFTGQHPSIPHPIVPFVLQEGPLKEAIVAELVAKRKELEVGECGG